MSIGMDLENEDDESSPYFTNFIINWTLQWNISRSHDTFH